MGNPVTFSIGVSTFTKVVETVTGIVTLFPGSIVAAGVVGDSVMAAGLIA